jgi:hypothetical protein
MRTLLFFVVSGGLLLAAQTEEMYTLKAKSPTQGTTTKVEQKISLSQLFTITPANGRKGEQGMKMLEQNTYTETALEVPANAPRATKFKRQYTRAEVSKNDQPLAVGYHGKTLVFEKKDDKYAFSLEGEGALTIEDRERLDRALNRSQVVITNHLFMPKQPVKVGDTWLAPLDVLIKDATATGLKIDAQASSGQVKLVKIFEQDKLPCAQLAITIKFALLELADKQTLKFQPGAELNVQLTVDIVRDGSRDWSRTNSTSMMSAKTNVNGNLVEIKSSTERTENRTEVPQ